jgi:thiol-disulfide isomerase/thioredoxin
MSLGARLSTMKLPIALVVAATLAHVHTAAADVLKVGDRLAELDVATDAAGKAFKLKTLKGKWVLITVGAQWCDACKKELPTWDKLAPDFDGKVTFVALNVNDKIDDGKSFNAKLKLKNMKLVYMPENKSAVSAQYGSDTMPTTFVADPEGVVRLVRDGFEKEDADGELKKMRDALSKLIAK